MLHRFSRTELLIGKDGLEKLKKAHVAVFGIGGVGSFAVEALVRTGIGELTLIDDDCVCLTNINRQIHATTKTVGNTKVEVMADRIKEINPKAIVNPIQSFYDITKRDLVQRNYSYIVDAIDTITSKLDLIIAAKENNIPIISSMGAGNKMDPTAFKVVDISETTICPMAKVMRKELRKKGLDTGLKVVFSTEKPMKPIEIDKDCRTDCICTNKERTCTTRRQIPGSIAFIPSVVGLIMAGEVIKDILSKEFIAID